MSTVLAPPPRVAAPAGRPPFTEEQRAAIADRSGSRLLAANAGSGKTAVMVERFVEAVLDDGVAVGAILALTFTEKAAGELRERIRHRFAELGRADLAREAEGAWVGTIHGFCARVLRSHPLAAGLDPAPAVLDEAAAARLAGAAFERALDAFVLARGAAGVDLAAAYGPVLREIVLGAHAALRSRGDRPRLAVPPEAPQPDPAPLAAARAAAAGHLATAKPGRRVGEAIRALEAADAVLARGGVPGPWALDAAALGSGAAALDAPACADYRTACAAYRAACADHHARADLELIAGLLARFDAEYGAARRDRGAVDFEDLELGVRDLLAADPALRARWAERFALIMVDEFQDTNRLQLDVLEALERGNLFAVGDEFQSIYGFRHADVTIFRDRRAALGPAGTRGLRANFRSAPELLDVLNAAFAPIFGERFAPLVAGRAPAATAAPEVGEGELRLFDPDRGAPPVELLVTDTTGWEADPDVVAAVGLTELAEQPWRRAEARLVARRLREEVAAGRRPADVVVLVRATASLRILEQALEEEGLPTYVVGGRGYWSGEQVRDGLAYLRTLANPLDEEALLGALASPFAGASADGLVLLARAGREGGRGAWAALREAAEGEGAGWLATLPGPEAERLRAFARLLEAERGRVSRHGADELLERALAATGYDLAVLARADGERRLANLRKLGRLAREYEAAEGRDLRGFLDFAATQELEAAREGEAPLEGEDLDAIRLMTIHRAKGLEFPVVCVADLGREPARAREPLLVGSGGEVGLRLSPLGGGKAVPALAYEELAEARARAEAEEERRLFYVAMTRAREKLILAGGTDAGRWPEPRPGRPPITWIARALLGERPGAVLGGAAAASPVDVERDWAGRPARIAAQLLRPAGAARLVPARTGRTPAVEAAHAAGASAVAVAPPSPLPATGRPQAPAQLSATSLADHARCPYRSYLRRVLGLPDVAPPPAVRGARGGGPGLDARARGTLVHRLLEDLDLRRPVPPSRRRVAALAAAHGLAPTPAELDELAALVGGFARSPLRARLAAAGHGVRREAPFAFALDPDAPEGPLLTGAVDVLAREPDGTVLVVDYKTDHLAAEETPADAVERAHATQRLVYALAALHEGAERVEVAHCFLERPEAPASSTFTRADLPELREELLALARGVVEGRHAPTAEPHRELCGTCPGRLALCSHPEDRTLRPAAQRSAGTFSGSGGPS